MRTKRLVAPALIVAALAAAGVAAIGPAGRGDGTPTLMPEIEAVLAQQDAAVAELRVRLQDAPTEREALVILRRIDACKRDAEIAVLRIQQRQALADGDQAGAARVEQAIAALARPVQGHPNAEVEKARRERDAGGARHD